jgi:hypothetical protein
MPKLRRSEETPWARKMNATRAAKVVVLEKSFAGVPAGSKLLIATPKIIADYIARIPHGEQRGIVRLRNELARRHRAHATCPVTTAIFLRIVAEAALDELARGASPASVTPFWRVIEPGSTIAGKLSCDSDWLRDLRETEGLVDPPPGGKARKDPSSKKASAKKSSARPAATESKPKTRG